MRRYFGKPTNITTIFMNVFQPSTISPPHSPTHTYRGSDVMTGAKFINLINRNTVQNISS